MLEKLLTNTIWEVVPPKRQPDFLIGPKIRKLGFHCPKGWLPWDKFAYLGKPGRGCGELS